MAVKKSLRRWESLNNVPLSCNIASNRTRMHFQGAGKPAAGCFNVRRRSPITAALMQGGTNFHERPAI
jgi:hypothetical protein